MRVIQNTQNIPRDPKVKNMFIPLRPGEVLLEADLSQAESRIVAWKGRVTKLIQLFNEGAKVHEYVASLMFQKPINKKDNPEEYQIGKKIGHLSNYDGAPKLISEEILNETNGKLWVPPDETKRRQNIYFQGFPQIRSGYQLGLKHEIMNSMGWLKTPIGHGGWQRKFYAGFSNQLWRVVYAHYAQNMVAFVTNNGIIRMGNSWAKYLYSQTHDSILMTVPSKMLKQCARSLEAAMTYELMINDMPLVIPVEMKVGERWGDMEDYNV